MITIYDSRCSMPITPGDGAPQTLPADTVWIDLYDATDEEAAYVQHVTGIGLPSQHRLAEVEMSSRLAIDGDTLVMSTPVLFRGDDGVQATPVGFVLDPKLLITLHSVELKSFADFVTRTRSPDAPPLRNGAEAFLGLLETIVDRMADGMESVGADLDKVSKRIFNTHLNGGGRGKPVRREQSLQNILQIIGRSGDTTAHARDTLLGLTRMLGFVHANADKRLSPEAGQRLDTVKQDVVSLNDYETHLTDKVQFLLDSTLGFISIEQNRTFKLLTIASVIGIPPTFVVGLYGMNFKNMPEYDWAYGYQWGLVLILISIVVPVVWLKVKGWF